MTNWGHSIMSIRWICTLETNPVQLVIWKIQTQCVTIIEVV